MHGQARRRVRCRRAPALPAPRRAQSPGETREGENRARACRSAPRPSLPRRRFAPRSPTLRPLPSARGPEAREVEAKPPFARKPVLQELEPRLLLSADLNPLAQDTLLATPAMQGAEFRALAEPGVPTVVTSAQVAPIQRTNELVFVDTATPEYQALVDAMRESALAQGRNLEFVLIDAERDGIRKITDTLAQKSDLDAIHIISHARDGAVQLGSAQLDFDTLLKRAASDQEVGRRAHRRRRHPDLRLRSRRHPTRPFADRRHRPAHRGGCRRQRGSHRRRRQGRQLEARVHHRPDRGAGRVEPNGPGPLGLAARGSRWST